MGPDRSLAAKRAADERIDDVYLLILQSVGAGKDALRAFDELGRVPGSQFRVALEGGDRGGHLDRVVSLSWGQIGLLYCDQVTLLQGRTDIAFASLRFLVLLS